MRDSREFSNPISSVILSHAVPFAIPSPIFSRYAASFSLHPSASPHHITRAATHLFSLILLSFILLYSS